MILTQGALSSGRKWLFDGDELLIRGGNSANEAEWQAPSLDALTECERGELSAIGARMLELADFARAYGLRYAAHIRKTGANKLHGLEYGAFQDALAGNPAFVVSDGDGKIIPDGDGILFTIAAEAAWKALKRTA